ncbi:MAG: hypothetical protein JO235_11935 [Chroococcidiopsidaceae cyanobacterium CP_BM_RX_35]|nr:hypothetical protein [Chroococcidiopsidaceae cyanobacterium CP_BM_RX_35]
MQIITLCSYVGEDGIMHLQVPVGKTDVDLEVVVIIQPSTSAKTNPPEVRGWPPGFFERTAGAWQGEPLTRAEQGEAEQRDELV